MRGEAVALRHIGNPRREESKYGWDYEELQQLLKARVHLDRPNIILSGVMGMATLTDDDDQVRAEFRRLRAYFEELKSTYFAKESDFSTISMGMSGDYPIALEEGSDGYSPSGRLWPPSPRLAGRFRQYPPAPSPKPRSLPYRGSPAMSA